MERFKKASSIIETLKQQGHEAYFVGGSVRDLIIDRPIGDIDIATSALPEEVMATPLFFSSEDIATVAAAKG